MALRGLVKAGYISLFSAAIMLSGCGVEGNKSENAAVQQPSATTETNTNSQAGNAAAETRVVTDQFGEVEIPVQPKRVTALYREDYLVALGVTPIVQYYNPMWGKQDYLELEVPLLDVTGSIEALLASEPDLIITAGEGDAAQYENYSKIAPTYHIANEVLSDTRETLKMIADLVGLPEKAEQVLQDYESRIGQVKEELKTALGEESIVVLRMNVVDHSINIFGTKNIFIGELLYKDLELKAPAYAQAMTEGNMVLAEESLPELGADHIILLPSNGTWEDEENAKALKEMLDSPIWKSIAAVKEGHVYPVERSYWQTGAITANFKKMDELLKLMTP
ncbi:iron complex transport system substrate-binding protein [Paenibacillus endophyticus]|uniref:Iron complex transport system substrate-binding protein n=1 Tax=Paenibacillus endophyticus TaxID=1294268 RepID=A0A7W5CB86_9BACL|nr:ABC transporter substrate-binding protein [Paenibacillus endophyticus]MBB3153989.1 iron complex transport system substrate-binding protein [Paenibacillus endophyticus]